MSFSERAVPPAYLGVWRRVLLRTAALEDTTSTVYWLQTARWHADIRIPAERPACPGAGGFAHLDRAQLLGLARQQGFAGVTEVDGDICRWRRRVDFQPPSGFNDIGRMVFESADRCLEYGVEQDYFEIWERLPGSTRDLLALAADVDDTTLRRLLDFEISFTVREPDGRWLVRHSTLPWCEGATLAWSDVLDAAGSLAQAARHWSVLA